MKALQNNKSLVIAIVVFIVAILVYNLFLQPTQTAINESVATQGVGNDVVSLYQSLQSATLDQSLFSSPTYRGLVDFSVTIPPQPVGRTNPFDIIGQ
jgi:hypothetical protein